MPEEALPVTTEVVTTVSDQLADITPEQVEAVMNAWNLVRQGDPVGTVRRSEQGEVAHRVSVDGVHLWRVSDVNGVTWSDTAPSLGWPVVWEVGNV